MYLLKYVAVTAAAAGLLALPARADDYHGWRNHHHHRGSYYGGPRVSVGIGIGPAPIYVPGPSYYGGPSYYYETAPVVVAPRPVVVGREVAGGDVVVEAQRALARKGYYRGAVDGDLGPRSRAAIREWQADCRLPITGQLDAATLRSLAVI